MQVHAVTCIPIARQWVAKHIPAEENARKIKTAISRQRRGKYTLSTIHVVFSVWSVPNCYKRTVIRRDGVVRVEIRDKAYRIVVLK
jgi:hypothetical protein